MNNISFDSQELINEVNQDIECFGRDEEVYVIYSWFPDIDQEFISIL